MYRSLSRDMWLTKFRLTTRSLGPLLAEDLDVIRALQKQANHEMISEVHRHSFIRIPETSPGRCPIRIGQLLPILVTPFRLASKGALWACAGMAIMMSRSSNWVTAPTDGDARAGATHAGSHAEPRRPPAAPAEI